MWFLKLIMSKIGLLPQCITAIKSAKQILLAFFVRVANDDLHFIAITLAGYGAPAPPSRGARATVATLMGVTAQDTKKQF